MYTNLTTPEFKNILSDSEHSNIIFQDIFEKKTKKLIEESYDKEKIDVIFDFLTDKGYPLFTLDSNEVHFYYEHVIFSFDENKRPFILDAEKMTVVIKQINKIKDLKNTINSLLSSLNSGILKFRVNADEFSSLEEDLRRFYDDSKPEYSLKYFIDNETFEKNDNIQYTTDALSLKYKEYIGINALR